MEFVTGNLLESDAQALVNTVNTVGVMGKGIALQFKEAFPNNFKAYSAACKRGEIQPGKLFVFKENTLHGEKIIVNFPTKTEWFKKSQYDYVESGLSELVNLIEKENIKSISIPPLGCGNGGLKWEKVKPMMERYLSGLNNVDIKVFEPNEQVKAILRNQDREKEAKLTPAKAMLLYAMFYYETLGESSSLFVANKLAYFLQRLGEKSLRTLKFDGHFYGPYSVQVGHMLRQLNGKYLKGLEQMEAKAFEPLELQYDAVSEVRDYVRTKLSAEQHSIIKQLVKLIDGYQSAFSLELLASVDFLKKEHPGIDKGQTYKAIKDWSKRKADLIKEKHIDVAWNHLNDYSTTLQFQV